MLSGGWLAIWFMLGFPLILDYNGYYDNNLLQTYYEVFNTKTTIFLIGFGLSFLIPIILIFYQNRLKSKTPPID